MASWPGVGRFTIRFTRTIGDDMVNVLHIRRDDLADPDVAWLEDVCEAIRDGWWDIAASTNDIRAVMANECVLADITGVSVDPSNPGLFNLLAVGTDGASGGTVLAPQLACVVTHRTAIASRAGRGRSYIGGLTSDDVDQSTAAYPVINSSTRTKIQNAFANLQTVLAALSVPSTHVIASTADEVARDVETYITRTKVFTQRRRA